MTTSARPGPVAVWNVGGSYSLQQTLGIIGRGPGDRTVRLAPGAAWLAFNTVMFELVKILV